MGHPAEEDDPLLEEPLGEGDEDEGTSVLELPPDEETLDQGLFGDEVIDLEGEEQVGLEDAESGQDVMDVADALDVGADEDGSAPAAESDFAGAEELGSELDDDGDDGEPSDEAEYGFTEDTEAPATEEWDAGVLELGDAPALGDDGGEEGIDDEIVPAAGGEDDFPGLPPLAARLDDPPDEEASDLDLAGEDEIDGPLLSVEAEERLMGLELPPPLGPDRVTVELVGPPGTPIYELAFLPGEPAAETQSGASRTGSASRASDPARGSLWAVGATLYRLRDGDLAPVFPEPLYDPAPTSVAVEGAPPHRTAVGTALEGVLRARSEGEPERVNEWLEHPHVPRVEHACYVFDEPAAPRRLWLRTRGGELYASDDFGDSYRGPLLASRVVAAAPDRDGHGVLVVDLDAEGRATARRTTDGGARFVKLGPVPLGGLPGDAGLALEAFGSTLVLTREDDARPAVVSTDGGASFSAVPALPNAGALALDGPATLYAALYFESGDRGVLVRHGTDDPEGRADAVVLDVAAERERRAVPAAGDPEGDNRIFAVRVEPAAGGGLGADTVLWCATGLGLLRVRVHGR
jgi:hypothetical protein